jgi:uncharacterized OB-fold protein
VGERISIVDYLVLDDGDPYLVASACQECGATYFERRNACARCFGTSFEQRRMPAIGTVRSYTIVHRAAPEVPVPFVSAIVELDGGGVVMTTFVAGRDDDGTEAVAFGFSPVAREKENDA